MVGCPPSRLVDVVGRDVLEIARDGVETQPAVRRAVGEPDAATRSERPADRGNGNERLGHVHGSVDSSQAAAERACVGSIEWATSDSWYSTSRPPASRSSRARRAKPTSMIGSFRAVRDEGARPLPPGQVRLPALDRGHEPRERENPRRRRPAGSEAERVAHHRAHREAAEHRALRRDARLLPERVVKRRQRAERRVERRRVRIADPRHDVPVVARPARKLERRAGRDDMQPACRIQYVREREQVALVGATAVVEDEQPLRL